MERLRQYLAATIAASLALVCVVVGVLAMTVLRPAQEIRASVSPETPYVTTRDGVFTLIGDSASVSATSTDGSAVSIAVGSVTDIAGWLAGSPYTEVIGIAGDRETLRTEVRGGADTSQSADGEQSAQSGEQTQSGNQAQSSDQAQSDDHAQSDAAQSGALTSAIASDMWIKEATAAGTVTMDLADIGAGKAILVATDGTSANYSVEIVWQTPKSNVVALSAFILAGALALIALIMALVSYQTGRTRAKAQPTTIAAKAPIVVDETDGEEPEATDDAELDDAAAPEDSEDTEAPAADPAPTEEPTDQAEPAAGRHGGLRVHDEDPPEVKATSGVIDLSSVRPGMVLPSRRALREAREQGKERLVIDGHEFDTGLIPIIAEPSTDDTEDPAAKGRWSSMMSAWTDRDGKESKE